MGIEFETVLNEYGAQVAAITRQLVLARAENEALRQRLADALNGETTDDDGKKSADD